MRVFSCSECLTAESTALNGTSENICVMSPFVSYYVKGQAPKTPFKAGRRFVFQARPDDIHLAQTIESKSACFARYSHNDYTRRITSFFVLASEMSDQNAKRGFQRTFDRALQRNCIQTRSKFRFWIPGHDMNSPRHTDIVLLPTPFHSRASTLSSAQRYIWVASNSMKASMIRDGFKPENIWTINPWSFLDPDDAFCKHDVRSRHKKIVLLAQDSENDVLTFNNMCNRLRSAHHSTNCLQTDIEISKSVACSARIVVIFTSMPPDWLFMERMIIAGKILIAPKSHVIDRALQEYHENFMYFYDDVDHALELIDKVQRNYEYFSTVAALSGKALRHVTEKYGTDGICEALLDYL